MPTQEQRDAEARERAEMFTIHPDIARMGAPLPRRSAKPRTPRPATPAPADRDDPSATA